MPAGVAVKQEDGKLIVSGKHGELSLKLYPGVEVSIEEGKVWIKKGSEEASGAVLGTAWSILKNSIQGVSAGFSKNLEIEGIGYRAVIEGKNLVLYIGYVNPVRVGIPDGITVAVEKSAIKISGIDKDLVGRFASGVRALKKPEPYKGKGIHYEGEVIRRKAGKKVATGTAA